MYLDLCKVTQSKSDFSSPREQETLTEQESALPWAGATDWSCLALPAALPELGGLE